MTDLEITYNKLRKIYDEVPDYKPEWKTWIELVASLVKATATNKGEKWTK